MPGPKNLASELKAQLAIKSESHAGFVAPRGGAPGGVPLWEVVKAEHRTGPEFYWTDARTPLDTRGNRMGFRHAPYDAMAALTGKEQSNFDVVGGGEKGERKRDPKTGRYI